MHPIKISLLFLSLFFISCNNFSYQKVIPGNYLLLEDDSFPSCKSLYYDLGSGHHTIRIHCVTKLGWNDSLIVAFKDSVYYVLNKRKDGKMALKTDVIRGPFSANGIEHVYDSLKLQDLDYDYDYSR
jgi:hypothetical protein